MLKPRQRFIGSSLSIVLLPMLGSAVMLVVGWQFFLFAVRAAPVINASILGTAVLAAALVLVGAIGLDRERRMLGLGLAALRGGTPAGLDALPDGIGARLLRRLARHGLGLGRALPESAIDGELMNGRQEIVLSQEPLQYLVGLLVALGLFGCFYGLLRTLVEAADILSLVAMTPEGGDTAGMMAVFARMVTQLQAPMKEMGTAFSASMFGLLGSIVIGLMLTLLRRRTDRTFDEARIALLALADAAPIEGPAPEVTVSEEFLGRFMLSLTEENRRAAALLAQALEALGRGAETDARMQAAVLMIAERLDRHARALAPIPAALERLERLPDLAVAIDGRLARAQDSLAAQASAQAALLARAQADSADAAARAAAQAALLDAQVSALRGLAAAQPAALAAGQRAADGIEALARKFATRFATHSAEARAGLAALDERLAVVAQALDRGGEAQEALLGALPAGFAALEMGLGRVAERLEREAEAIRARGDLLRGVLETRFEAQQDGLRRIEVAQTGLLAPTLRGADALDALGRDLSGGLAALDTGIGRVVERLEREAETTRARADMLRAGVETRLEAQQESLRRIEATQPALLVAAQRGAEMLGVLGRDLPERLSGLGQALRGAEAALGGALAGIASGTARAGDAGSALLAQLPSGFAALETGLGRIGDRLARADEAARGQEAVLRIALDGEQGRIAAQRHLADALHGAVAGFDRIREEIAAATRQHGVVAERNADLLKGLEHALAVLNRLNDDRLQAQRAAAARAQARQN
jgi:hypothetical protein